MNRMAERAQGVDTSNRLIVMTDPRIKAGRGGKVDEMEVGDTEKKIRSMDERPGQLIHRKHCKISTTVSGAHKNTLIFMYFRIRRKMKMNIQQVLE